MMRSRAALKLRQSQFREKYIETSYIKLYAKPKNRNFKVRIEPWMVYRTAYRTVQYYVENCDIPNIHLLSDFFCLMQCNYRT